MLLDCIKINLINLPEYLARTPQTPLLPKENKENLKE